MTSLILDIESASKSEFYNDWMRPQGIPPDHFGLLLQQARLVSALAAGHSIGDFAERVGLSQNTVRNQLAAAFAKTQTSRQAELVALVIRRLKWRRIGGQIR